MVQKSPYTAEFVLQRTRCATPERTSEKKNPGVQFRFQIRSMNFGQNNGYCEQIRFLYFGDTKSPKILRNGKI